MSGLGMLAGLAVLWLALTVAFALPIAIVLLTRDAIRRTPPASSRAGSTWTDDDEIAARHHH